MAPSPSPPVLWVKVPKPSFDLIGVILGSLSLAGAVAVLAMLLGVVAGLLLLRRKRRERPGLGLSGRP
jgi:hypothetical protein